MSSIGQVQCKPRSSNTVDMYVGTETVGSGDVLEYRVERGAGSGGANLPDAAGYGLRGPDGVAISAVDDGALLFRFEKELTTRIQLLRSDLLFLHAAVLELEGRAIVLVGDPGSGKTTLAYSLLERGLGYLSDELAPVDLASATVMPYPRALWLKRAPDCPPGLVAATSRGFHVPCTALGADAFLDPLPLGAIFLLSPGVAERREPTLGRVSGAEALARLYANVLNPAGHPLDGLDAATAVVGAAPCYALEPGEVVATGSMIVDAVRRESRGGRV